MDSDSGNLQDSGPLQVVYRETFAAGPGAWSTGKAAPDGTWHRNIFGDPGKPVPLGWSETGGRSGGCAYTEPPWYFDDNHGQFTWLYLAFFVNRSELVGLAGRDLRDGRIELRIRGRRFDPRGTDLFFWIQGTPREDTGHPKGAMYNWALTSQPVTGALLDGEWHDEAVTLPGDEGRWSSMGHLSGGLARGVRIVQSLTVARGSLDAILGGRHVNFGFLLCGVDPNDPPAGRIELDEVTILARA